MRTVPALYPEKPELVLFGVPQDHEEIHVNGRKPFNVESGS